MFYVHQINCISPQQTFNITDIEQLLLPVNKKLNVIEPVYQDIPKNSLRRMGKTVRIGIAAAMEIIKQAERFDGIVIGTGNGGMEDSIIFLKQVIEYNEGLLTPAHFVQSTSNAVASQLSLASVNRGYNITHVHRGLAFEMAAIDVAMRLLENRQHSYLLGGVDEISGYNYKLDYLDGWYKKEEVDALGLYDTDSPGTIAGEGAVAMLVNNTKNGAIAKVVGLTTLHSTDVYALQQHLQNFLKQHEGLTIDLLLSGENGDNRSLYFYTGVEGMIQGNIPIARFKHMCGEYPTASSFALWLACKLIEGAALPAHMLKKGQPKTAYNNVLIYNCHKNLQHSFILVSLAE